MLTSDHRSEIPLEDIFTSDDNNSSDELTSNVDEQGPPSPLLENINFEELKDSVDLAP
jgi:hypothetical protein